MLWLPIFTTLFFLAIQATSAKKGIVRYSFLAVFTHTLVLIVFFVGHPLMWIVYILTTQMWALFIVSLYRRNKWREQKLV